MKVKDFLKITEEKTFKIKEIEKFYERDELLEEHGNKTVKNFYVSFDVEDAYNVIENVFIYIVIEIE